MYEGVLCNARDTSMLCSMCSHTKDGCQEDCEYDDGINLCYKRGNSKIKVILLCFAIVMLYFNLYNAH